MSLTGTGFCVKPYYKAANYSMRNSVGYLMRICTNRLLPQMEALFQDQELTFSQWTTLVALHDGRVSTAGDLAHNICHDAGSLTRLIDQMVERGLVARGRSDTDRPGEITRNDVIVGWRLTSRLLSVTGRGHSCPVRKLIPRWDLRRPDEERPPFRGPLNFRPRLWQPSPAVHARSSVRASP